ncbi:MAG: peptidoglycan recognition family protein [Candidatus Gastranaerophilales bacterium]|nr:peptidoglycan recognition family protein [Candidatus Gastranaerophilales bacterium]
MRRIIVHWSAGGPIPTSYEKGCYHFLIDSLGKVHLGKFKPEANLNCRKGLYAMHTGGGNTGSIGVSMCGMSGFKNKNDLGRFPITKIQFEAAMKLCAKLTKKYGIQITPETVMTHYEFGQKHPNTTSHGKIDIIFLPPYPWISKDDIGSFIRSKIRWYLENE